MLQSQLTFFIAAATEEMTTAGEKEALSLRGASVTHVAVNPLHLCDSQLV